MKFLKYHPLSHSLRVIPYCLTLALSLDILSSKTAFSADLYYHSKSPSSPFEAIIHKFQYALQADTIATERRETTEKRKGCSLAETASQPESPHLVGYSYINLASTSLKNSSSEESAIAFLVFKETLDIPHLVWFASVQGGEPEGVHPSFATLNLSPSPRGRSRSVSAGVGASIRLPFSHGEKGLGDEGYEHGITHSGCPQPEVVSNQLTHPFSDITIPLILAIETEKYPEEITGENIPLETNLALQGNISNSEMILTKASPFFNKPSPDMTLAFEQYVKSVSNSGNVWVF